MSSADTTHNKTTGSGYRTLSKVLLTLLSAGLLVLFGIFGIAMLNEMANMPRPLTEAEKAAAAAASAPAAPAPAPVAPAPAPGGDAAAVPPAGTPAPTPAPAAATGSFAALGASMYNNCIACHGDKGQGPPVAMTPPMAPVLAGSAFVNGPTERLAMILLNGIQQEGRYLGIMVSMKPIMDDEKMAAVLTHIRTNFGNNAPPVTPDQVKAARLKYESRSTPFLRSELDAVTTNLP